MYRVEIPEGINRIRSIFYRLGIWHTGDEPTIRETRIKYLYSVSFLMFIISLIGGAINTENRDDSIFLVESSIVVSVLFMKLLYVIWKKEQILEMMQRICVYTIDDRDG